MRKIINEEDEASVNEPVNDAATRAANKIKELNKNSGRDIEYLNDISLNNLKNDFDNERKPKKKAAIFNSILQNHLITNNNNKNIINRLFKIFGDEYWAGLGNSLSTQEMYPGNQYINFLNGKGLINLYDNVPTLTKDTFSKCYNLYAMNDLLTDNDHYIDNNKAIIYNKSLYDKSMDDILNIVKLDKELLLKDDSEFFTEGFIFEGINLRDAILLDRNDNVLNLPAIKSNLKKSEIKMSNKLDDNSELKEIKSILKRNNKDELENLAKILANNSDFVKTIVSLSNANSNNE